jgi:hypothetical protein
VVSLAVALLSVAKPVAAYGIAVDRGAVDFSALGKRRDDPSSTDVSNPFQSGGPFSGNPFTGGGSGGGGSSSDSGSGGGNGNGSGGGSGSGSGSGRGGPNGRGRLGDLFEDQAEHFRNTHGIIMALVVVILFPLGAIVMRVFGKWWLHAGFQVMGIILLLAGFGIGVFLARAERRVSYLDHHFNVYDTVANDQHSSSTTPIPFWARFSFLSLFFSSLSWAFFSMHSTVKTSVVDLGVMLTSGLAVS